MSESASVTEPEGSPLQALPLVTLYLTDRCNSRCITCDYWRHGRTNLTLEALRSMLRYIAFVSQGSVADSCARLRCPDRTARRACECGNSSANLIVQFLRQWTCRCRGQIV